MEPTHLPVAGQCRQVNDIVSLVGDKWSVLVVVMLGEGKQRFSALKREIDGISQKMLTVTLRGLERDGYLTRTIYPTIPPRVDYELTALGHELLVPVRALGRFAMENRVRVLAARQSYDSRRLAEAAE